MELFDKIRLEVAVLELFVEPTVRAIARAARTGEIGDGKIFVLPIEHILRIRTSEVDEAAIR